MAIIIGEFGGAAHGDGYTDSITSVSERKTTRDYFGPKALLWALSFLVPAPASPKTAIGAKPIGETRPVLSTT